MVADVCQINVPSVVPTRGLAMTTATIPATLKLADLIRAIARFALKVASQEWLATAYAIRNATTPSVKMMLATVGASVGQPRKWIT